ncbi:FH protein interacting protein FIP2-like [Bidens hawaiensis]|uniref:FH protein interacting protein FIP2-like n=1 Tax=Bidens hawaiensis TaxID=980011 RepID=UPI0040495669
MATYSDACVRLDIGGNKFVTTVDTLTHREPHSMLTAMFSGRHALCKDSEGYVFVDRDGKHFRHILNWLRGGLTHNLSELERIDLLELSEEAEYYQLLGLVEKINEVLKRKEDEQVSADLTRADIIKYARPCNVKHAHMRLRGVNLSGLDLSKLDLSGVDFSFACLNNAIFSDANLENAKFEKVDAENANFHNATLKKCKFTMANLHGALLVEANLDGADLYGCDLRGADLRCADLSCANLVNAKLNDANL